MPLFTEGAGFGDLYVGGGVDALDGGLVEPDEVGDQGAGAGFVVHGCVGEGEVEVGVDHFAVYRDVLWVLLVDLAGRLQCLFAEADGFGILFGFAESVGEALLAAGDAEGGDDAGGILGGYLLAHGQDAAQQRDALLDAAGAALGERKEQRVGRDVRTGVAGILQVPQFIEPESFFGMNAGVGVVLLAGVGISDPLMRFGDALEAALVAGRGFVELLAELERLIMVGDGVGEVALFFIDAAELFIGSGEAVLVF